MTSATLDSAIETRIQEMTAQNSMTQSRTHGLQSEHFTKNTARKLIACTQSIFRLELRNITSRLLLTGGNNFKGENNMTKTFATFAAFGVTAKAINTAMNKNIGGLNTNPPCIIPLFIM